MKLIGYDEQGTGTVVEAIYNHRGRDIRVAATPGDLPAQLTAAFAAIGITETMQAYSDTFLANKAKIFNAISTFGDGWRLLYVDDTTAPTLTQKQTVLGDTLTIILTMDQPLVRELTVERLALGLPGAPVSAWTATQCGNWQVLLSGWLGRAHALLVGAMAVGDVD